jgi:hypothetical protein
MQAQKNNGSFDKKNINQHINTHTPTPSTICGWPPPGFTPSATDGVRATSSISLMMDLRRETCNSPNNLESYQKKLILI